MSWTVGEYANWCGGRLRGDGTVTIEGVSIDTRSIGPGQLFIAIRGENFDGHDFTNDAVERGARALLISENGHESAAVPVIRVDDTVRAFGELAQQRRQCFSGPVIAITGSNGKTTTKEMCADILEAAGVRVRRSRGNLNNHIGLPLSILSLEADDEVLVVEMGMNHAGEIDALARIASPDVGAITQVAPAHLGLLGSIEAIALAKGELLDRIRVQGTAVLNTDDRYVGAQAHRFKGRHVLFGRSERADFRSEKEQVCGLGTSFSLQTPEGECNVTLPQPGLALVEDALCATACAYASGLIRSSLIPAIRRGLERFQGVAGRLFVRRTSTGLVVLDDTYNANPESVERALEALSNHRADGRAIAVLGDMLELGEEEQNRHKAIGERVAALRIDLLVTLGRLSMNTAEGARRAGLAKVVEATDANDAANQVRAFARRGDVVLVKGSRGMRMENVVSALMEPS